MFTRLAYRISLVTSRRFSDIFLERSRKSIEEEQSKDALDEPCIIEAGSYWEPWLCSSGESG